MTVVVDLSPSISFAQFLDLKELVVASLVCDTRARLLRLNRSEKPNFLRRPATVPRPPTPGFTTPKKASWCHAVDHCKSEMWRGHSKAPIMTARASQDCEHYDGLDFA